MYGQMYGQMYGHKSGGTVVRGKVGKNQELVGRKKPSRGGLVVSVMRGAALD